jgi:hypothetical protein
MYQFNFAKPIFTVIVTDDGEQLPMLGIKKTGQDKNPAPF